MEIRFLGAVGVTTGSMHLVQAGNTRILLDCGLFQGRRKESYQRNLKFPFDPKSIDAVLLSHAHVDHCGNLPNLVKAGFGGKIYCTSATRDLAGLMLRDTGFIMQKDAEYINQKTNRRGLPKIKPLYDIAAAEKALQQFRGIAYHQTIKLARNLHAAFFDAGHILGSALIFLEYDQGQTHLKLTYACDLGRKNKPILRDPEFIKGADYLVLESTYGDRKHENAEEARNRLVEIITRTYQRGGKIIVPSFSLERTQDLVYMLKGLKEAKKIPDLPVFIDSPLAVNVTEVFRLHPECFDDETNKYLFEHEDPFGMSKCLYIRGVSASRKLNEYKNPCIIISASGMCEAGRILHHLKHNIEDARNTILVVGFMAPNTLGRRIVEKQSPVSIFGESLELRAEVESLSAFSAHADSEELVDYVNETNGKYRGVFLVHGDDDKAEALKEKFESTGHKEIIIPHAGQQFVLGGRRRRR